MGMFELFLKLFSTWPFDARLHAIPYPNDHMKNNIVSSLGYGTYKLNENKNINGIEQQQHEPTFHELKIEDHQK